MSTGEIFPMLMSSIKKLSAFLADPYFFATESNSNGSG